MGPDGQKIKKSISSLSNPKLIKFMNPKTFTAIFVSGKGTLGQKWYKYRKISNNNRSIENFVKFAKTKGANEINFYCSITGVFWAKVHPE